MPFKIKFYTAASSQIEELTLALNYAPFKIESLSLGALTLLCIGGSDFKLHLYKVTVSAGSDQGTSKIEELHFEGSEFKTNVMYLNTLAEPHKRIVCCSEFGEIKVFEIRSPSLVQPSQKRDSVAIKSSIQQSQKVNECDRVSLTALEVKLELSIDMQTSICGMMALSGEGSTAHSDQENVEKPCGDAEAA